LLGLKSPHQHDLVFTPSPHPLLLLSLVLIVHRPAPVTHRDQGYIVMREVLLHTQPLSVARTQKIVGSMPCPIGYITNLMVINQPLISSRHRRGRIKNYYRLAI